MLKKDGKDYILVVWKDPVERKRYVIGEIVKNGGYEFSYGYDIHDALKNGFELLIAFNDINKIYSNKFLFPAFASRLPDKRRKDINNILARYDMTEYDSYKLLKRSGGRSLIDTMEFVDPIDPFDEENIVRYFYIAGLRHYDFCKGKVCVTAEEIKNIGIKKGVDLKIDIEPQNEHDDKAIVISFNKNKLGYVPRHYSESITRLIRDKRKITCTVEEVNKQNFCDECIKICFKIEKKEKFI